MLFGLNIGTHDPPAGGNHWDVTRSIIQTCEEAGFDSVWLNDHFMFRPPPGSDEVYPWLECMIGLGAIAAITERVKLGALVAGVPYRNPALFAKMSTTLDIISHGRSIVGIGAGWHKDEFDAYGWPFPSVKERMEMLEEATLIIKAMMTNPSASFTGKHYRIDDALNHPQPVQRPHPPIMIGGGGEKRTLRLVARHADWANVSGKVEEVARKWEVLRAHCEEADRPYDEITRSLDFRCLIGRDEDDLRRKREQFPEFGGWTGTVDEVVDLLNDYAAVGTEYVIFFMPDAAGLDSIRLWGEVVVPALRDA